MNRLHPQTMYASVREYLQELEESGVDGLPLETVQQAELPGDREPLRQQPAQVPAARPQTLAELCQRIGDCQRCDLCHGRTNLVFGAGYEKARLVFVGEAPGADEDRQGQPFVGEAGQVLTRLIEAMGLKRAQVYICNVLKCRPPANRNPHKDEIATCSPFLTQQLQIIKPEVIVALGTFAAQTLLNSKEPISRMRGQFHSWHGIPVMPTFHPSFLLHNKENKQHYWDVWSDMEQVLHKLKLPVPEKKKKA
ncbi:DNA polymerase [Trichlorobacter thiogenes]|uniref:Type-4 uracil-DNA glycosylase n=1 Tax=Trichlorobacter thiogenes TaxID=115783 RepID=A0A1T4JVK9_9BACT|nr:uracil-DNA glycosylase [Trichlorobacter thiogenes]SJZ34193.1 DNA polymerase [Trichlorobacter thiogenes]